MKKGDISGPLLNHGNFLITNLFPIMLIFFHDHDDLFLGDVVMIFLWLCQPLLVVMIFLLVMKIFFLGHKPFTSHDDFLPWSQTSSSSDGFLPILYS
jgi:hypothetical protein